MKWLLVVALALLVGCGKGTSEESDDFLYAVGDGFVEVRIVSNGGLAKISLDEASKIAEKTCGLYGRYSTYLNKAHRHGVGNVYLYACTDNRIQTDFMVVS